MAPRLIFNVCLTLALSHSVAVAAVSSNVGPQSAALSATTSPEHRFNLSGVDLAQIYANPSDAAQTIAPTAVYDISAHVVVMPDGTRLEAHSGLGDRVDSPRFVRLHMRGSTPPALYALALRKRLFHGVMVLSLNPLLGDVFGRTALLAHTYMLHNLPQSNGCVVFRDYAAFLNAFREGRIRWLRVVPSVGDAALRIASTAHLKPRRVNAAVSSAAGPDADG